MDERYGNHQEVCEAFDVDEQGIIRSPGKWEGEPTYILYFWEAYMNGAFDEFEGDDVLFNVDDQDIARFPALEGHKQIKLWTDNEGFAYTFAR